MPKRLVPDQHVPVGHIGCAGPEVGEDTTNDSEESWATLAGVVSYAVVLASALWLLPGFS